MVAAMVPVVDDTATNLDAPKAKLDQLDDEGKVLDVQVTPSGEVAAPPAAPDTTTKELFP